MEENKIEVVEPIKTEEKNSQTTETANNSKGFSIASLILGLAGLLIAAIPCGTLAIIFGIMGRKKGGKEMATAGFILGIADIAFGAIYFIIMIITSTSILMNL